MVDDAAKLALRGIIERCRGVETCYVTPEEYRIVSAATCEPADDVEIYTDSYEHDTQLEQTIREVFAEHGWPANEKPVALVVRGGLPDGFWNDAVFEPRWIKCSYRRLDEASGFQWGCLKEEGHEGAHTCDE